MNCHYHPDRDAVGACVNCGRLVCPECKTVLGGRVHCNPCAETVFAGRSTSLAEPTQPVTYSKALRWISGIMGVSNVFGGVSSLEYYAEASLAGNLLVGIFTILEGIVLLLMAIRPQWVSRLGIKLEKGEVFGVAVLILVIVGNMATGLEPVPPGGWWEYGG